MLSVLKNICKVEFNASDCSECKINAVCDYGCGTEAIKNLDIKYEPDDKKEKNIYDISYKFSEKKDEDAKNGH